MLGRELGADQERRAERRDLGEALVARPEGEDDREGPRPDQDRDAQRLAGRRPAPRC